MAVTISKLNVILSGSMGGLVSLFSGAQKQVHGFESSIGDAGSRINGILAGIGLGVSVAGVVALVHHSMEAIDVTAKLADRLGITTEALTGLQHGASLAGVGNEALTDGIDKMMKTLGGAADDTEQASNAFTKLGLKASDLANLPTDQAFATIAEQISKIQNPTERATAAVGIFGKAGASLLPLLQGGAAGIRQAEEEAKKLGMTFSRVDAAKVEAANDSFTRLEGVVTGVGNQLAIGLAPYIDAATKKLTDLATTGGGIGPRVGGAVEWVAKAVAYASDFLSVFAAGWQVLRGAASYALGSVLDGLGAVVGGVEWLYEKLNGTSSHFGDGMQVVAKSLLAVGDDAFHQAGEDWDDFMNRTNSKAVNRAFGELRQGADAAAQAVADGAAKMKGAYDGDTTKGIAEAAKKIAALQKQIDDFGKTAGEKAAGDVAAAGGTPAQQAQAKALGEHLDQLDAMKKAQDQMKQDAQKMWADVQTPAEKYAKQLEQINALLESGSIDQETAGRATAKAEADLAKAGGKSDAGKVEGPKLLEAGTQDVAKFVAEVQQKQKGEDRDREQLAEAKRTSGYLKVIADKVTAPPVDDGVESIFTA